MFMARPLRVGRDGARGYVHKESEGPGRGLEAGVELRVQKRMDTGSPAGAKGSESYCRVNCPKIHIMWVARHVFLLRTPGAALQVLLCPCLLGWEGCSAFRWPVLQIPPPWRCGPSGGLLGRGRGAAREGGVKREGLGADAPSPASYLRSPSDPKAA